MIMMSGDHIITDGKKMGYVACIGEKRNAYRVWLGNHLENLALDGKKMIFKTIFKT